jgi:hypothetical protein
MSLLHCTRRNKSATMTSCPLASRFATVFAKRKVVTGEPDENLFDYPRGALVLGRSHDVEPDDS